MTEIIIRIQSLNDIITNSSTEIITTITDNAVDTIKEMVNTLMSTCGSNCCFDDLFTITTHWDRENEWDGLGYDSKEKYIKDLEKYGGNLGGAASGISYSVKAKDPKNEKAAKLLNRLQGIIDCFETYS